mgnify:CR=1 FL=1
MPRNPGLGISQLKAMNQLVARGFGHHPSGQVGEVGWIKVLLPEGSKRPPGDLASPWDDHLGWVIEDIDGEVDIPGLLEEEEAAAWLFADSVAFGAGR